MAATVAVPRAIVRDGIAYPLASGQSRFAVIATTLHRTVIRGKKGGLLFLLRIGKRLRYAQGVRDAWHLGYRGQTVPEIVPAGTGMGWIRLYSRAIVIIWQPTDIAE
jgi:hypothetical protein